MSDDAPDPSDLFARSSNDDDDSHDEKTDDDASSVESEDSNESSVSDAMEIEPTGTSHSESSCCAPETSSTVVQRFPRDCFRWC